MIQETSLTLEILKRAMSIEIEGRKFYREAAQTTQDKNGQETFRKLADDEQNHYSLLKSQYDALKNDDDRVASPAVQTVSIDLTKPLFPRGIEALKSSVTVKSNDWNALLFGLDIEIRSYDLYRKAAVNITDAMGKQILGFLAEQEMGHFNLLMMRYEALFGPSSWWD